MDGTFPSRTASRLARTVAAFSMLFAAGCTTAAMEPDVTGVNYARVQVPAVADPMEAARKAYGEQNFAHAARYYEMAMAREGDSGEALLGAAASYDRMWRFDLSEAAYRRAEPLVGGTAEYLNNRGYSYLTQGKFDAARQHFLRARKIAPNDPVVAGNLKLLDRLSGPSQAG